MKYDELKDSLDDFIKEWNMESDYIIFGDSEKVDFLTEVLSNLRIKYIVDNDIKKHGTKKKGYKILSPDVLKHEADDVKIIIASDSFYQISKQLKEMGFQENTHYVSHSKLLSTWKWYYEHILCLMRTDIMITSRCTLNCKYCNMFMPYYSKPEHKRLEEIQEDIDLYFKVVDYVVIFQVIGGEVFLHPNLYEILNFIFTKYSDKIHTILIVSNGTIIPSSDILNLCSKYNVVFSISDYTSTVNYKDKIIQFTQLLDKYKIKYAVTNMNWADFGSPLVKKNIIEDQLIAFFNSCRAPFRGLGSKRLYYCHLNYSAVTAGIFPDNKNDYFELDIKREDKEKKSIELLKFDMGYTDSGYITFCANCNGCGGINENFVKAGEQVPRR